MTRSLKLWDTRSHTHSPSTRPSACPSRWHSKPRCRSAPPCSAPSSVGSQIALQAAAAATTVGVQLPNSRSQESEADRIGIELAAKAGYDPHAAVTLWQKMTQATGGAGKSDFLSTHPASDKRMEALAQLIPQMMPYYEDKSPRPDLSIQERQGVELRAFRQPGPPTRCHNRALVGASANLD